MPSNYPLSYKLSWLPRFLCPSLGGHRPHCAPPAQEPGADTGRTARLVFLGDISAVASDKPPIIDQALQDRMARAQLVIANCESPVIAHGQKQPGTFLGIRHAMKRQFLSDVVAAAGISADRLVLSVANNHALDQGKEGFDRTMDELAGLGIRTIGDAGSGPVKDIVAGSMRLGIAAFTEWRNGPAKDFAGRVMTDDAFERDGWEALRNSDADFLCAVPHWDWEFRHFPRPAVQAKARKLAQSGVGLIAGGHAHVVQPVERIGDTLVAYGLGDFLGTAWRHCRWPLRLGAMLVVEVMAGPSAPARRSGKIASYEVVPFARQQLDGRQHLVPLEAIGPDRSKAFAARWRSVFSAPAM